MTTPPTADTTIQQQIAELLKESETIANKNPTRGVELAKQAQELAHQNNLPEQECLALLHIASANTSAADNSNEAENILTSALALAQENGLTELLLEALLKMASLHSSANRIEMAEDFVRRAKLCFSELKKPAKKLELKVLYDDVSIRYRKSESPATLLTDCLYGLENAKELQDDGLQTCFLQMLIMISANAGDTDKAIFYSKQFLAIEEKQGFYMNLVGAYIFQSDLYEKTGNVAETENSFAKAIAASKKLGDERSYYVVELRRVKFLLKHKRYAEAKTICEQLALLPVDKEMTRSQFSRIVFLSEIAQAENRYENAILLLENELPKYEADKLTYQRIAQQLHKLHAATGNYPTAYKMLLTYQELTKEIFDAEKAKEYAELHTRYETKEKEAQLRESKLLRIDAELKAIKSQMNPHFAFNTLKTIDQHLENQNISSARESLNNFAQLMRATLQQSGSEFTLIEDEVLLLQNYIQLEKSALGDSFHYTIEVDSAIDQSYERVPSIFLQPVIENAIKHGLRHQQGEKNLKVVFKLNEEALFVTVEDNGIGRKASAALNKFRINHQSFAGDAMQKRVEFLNEKAGFVKYEFVIEDLAQGTRATLCIRQSAS